MRRRPPASLDLTFLCDHSGRGEQPARDGQHGRIQFGGSFRWVAKGDESGVRHEFFAVV